MEFQQTEKRFKSEQQNPNISTSNSNNNNTNNTPNQGFQFVSDKIELYPQWQSGMLDGHKQDLIKKETLRRLATVEPLLQHTAEVKVVSNPRRNFINVMIRKEYLPLIYYQKVDEVYFCFFLSDKLEPYVIITALDPRFGRLLRLTAQQLEAFGGVLQNFKRSFGIQGESYHYTQLDERKTTDSFSKNSGLGIQNKSHSTHWHLKMRVSTLMIKDKMPILKMISFDRLKEQVEPVKYNYERTTLSQSEIWEKLKEDTV